MNTKDKTPKDKEPTEKTTMSLADIINAANEEPENEFVVTAADYLQRQRIKDEEAGFGTTAATSLVFTGIEPLTPELLNLVKPPKSFVPTVRILREDNETMNSKEPNFHPLIKIKWSGQKNQLYDVIRQLKERENKILNSYTDLAVFLKTNFDIFDNTSLSTIETELQRGKRPAKAKRIDLDKTDQPE